MVPTTYLKNVKLTPKKLRMLRDTIVQMKPQAALDYLLYTPSKSARMFYKIIHSAISNATLALKVTPDMLQFKLLTIEEGQKLKRFNAGSKGMAKPFVRRTSHVKIILEEALVKEVKKVKRVDDTKKSTPKRTKDVVAKDTVKKEVKKIKKTVTKAKKA